MTTAFLPGLCQMNSYAVPEGPPYFANGGVKSITKCETHNWMTEGPASGLCPIGRIEQATEDALERIQQAVGGSIPPMSPMP
jgi:hypothetical protein